MLSSAQSQKKKGTSQIPSLSVLSNQQIGIDIIGDQCQTAQFIKPETITNIASHIGLASTTVSSSKNAFCGSQAGTEQMVSIGGMISSSKQLTPLKSLIDEKNEEKLQNNKKGNKELIQGRSIINEENSDNSFLKYQKNVSLQSNKDGSNLQNITDIQNNQYLSSFNKNNKELDLIFLNQKTQNKTTSILNSHNNSGNNINSNRQTGNLSLTQNTNLIKNSVCQDTLLPLNDEAYFYQNLEKQYDQLNKNTQKRAILAGIFCLICCGDSAFFSFFVISPNFDEKYKLAIFISMLTIQVVASLNVIKIGAVSKNIQTQSTIIGIMILVIQVLYFESIFVNTISNKLDSNLFLFKAINFQVMSVLLLPILQKQDLFKTILTLSLQTYFFLRLFFNCNSLLYNIFEILLLIIFFIYYLHEWNHKKQREMMDPFSNKSRCISIYNNIMHSNLNDKSPEEIYINMSSGPPNLLFQDRNKKKLQNLNMNNSISSGNIPQTSSFINHQRTTAAKTMSQNLISTASYNNSALMMKYSATHNFSSLNQNQDFQDKFHHNQSQQESKLPTARSSRDNLLLQIHHEHKNSIIINNDKIEGQEMSKISELDLENEITKNNQNNNSPQNSQYSKQINSVPKFLQTQNYVNNSLQTPVSEQKTLIDQLIEVDGIVVFEQDTQAVIYTNQNILNLFETDASQILNEVQKLKHFSFDDTKSKEDFSISHFLKHVFKDQSVAGISLSSPQFIPFSASKIIKLGSYPHLNQVIEEEENEQKDQNLKNKKRNLQQDSKGTVNDSPGNLINSKKLSFLQLNKSISTKLEKGISSQKSKTLSVKIPSPLLGPYQEGNFQEEDDEYAIKHEKRRAESIFKTLPPKFNSQADLSNQAQSIQEHQSFLSKYQPEMIEQQFPSFLSSVNAISQRKHSQLGIPQYERDRTSTLKDLIDEVRSKSSTLFAQRKSTYNSKKKTLAPKKCFNYSSSPEVVAGNMVLFKESQNRVFLAKYSVAEHASRMLHILTIRDLSVEIFDQILERQSMILIEELYAHLRGSEISDSLYKSLKLAKNLKQYLDNKEYCSVVTPLRSELKIFKNVLNDVFDMRLLQQKQFKLNLDYFDLQGELLKTKKTIEQGNDVAFSFYFDKKIPLQVKNDKDRLSQIMTNLLLCASQLASNKAVFLRAKLTQDQQAVKISIQNNEVSSHHKSLAQKATPTQGLQYPPHNYLAYHFFVSNQLAIHLSNHKQSLIVETSQASTLKLKFLIYLFPSVIDSSKQPVDSNIKMFQTDSIIKSDGAGIISKSNSNVDCNKDFVEKQENEQPLKIGTNQLSSRSKNSSYQLENQDFEGMDISEMSEKQKIPKMDSSHQLFPVRFIKELSSIRNGHSSQ